MLLLLPPIVIMITVTYILHTYYYYARSVHKLVTCMTSVTIINDYH